MKFSIFLLVAFVALAASSTIYPRKPFVVKGRQLLERQQQILQLFDRVVQYSHIPEHVEIAQNYKIEEHVTKYEPATVVEGFLQYHHNDPIGRTEIFSIFNEKQARNAIALFKLFFHAKDYETFYKTAVWARNHVNYGMFIYSLSVAVLHRPDTDNIVLPPIHEIYPYYFFPTEVIHKAQYYKQVHDEEEMDKDKDFHGYTIDANYSGHYLNLHPEQSLSYYLEDIDMNSMHYYYNLHYPTWMSSEQYELKHMWRGAFNYFRTQQMLARFYLERLANKRGEIPMLDLDVPVETPYTPSLMYPNGLEFPSRPKFANLHEYFYNYGQKYTFSETSYSFKKVKDLERRILNAVDSRFVVTENKNQPLMHLNTQTQEGLDILGNIIESNADSINKPFYSGMQTYMRHLLGYSMQPLDNHKLVPSALEHHETAHRDPIYHQIMKGFMGIYRSYMENIPSYTKKEIIVPEFQITDVQVDDLITYMDLHYSDITNAVFFGPHETRNNFRVSVRQQRLNHKPFEYKLQVQSKKNQKAVVKVFLGPKYDEYDRYMNLTENHLNFIEMDFFVTEMKVGHNTLERSSHQFDHFAPDRVPGWKLYQQLQTAMEQNKEVKVDYRQNWYKLPQRFMLPRGSKEGTTYQLFFFVYPYTSTQGTHDEVNEVYHMADVDTKPYGFPLERVVKYYAIFNVPNAHFHEVKIFHQDVYGLNMPTHHEH